MPFSPARALHEYRHGTFALHQHHYRGRMFIGRKIITLRPGDVTITPPHVVSRYELEEEGYHWCIHFQPTAIPAGSPRLRLPLHLPMLGGGGHVTERMRQIAECTRERTGSRDEKQLAVVTASAMLQELLLVLALGEAGHKRSGRTHKKKSENLLDAARDRIEREFHLPLSMAGLAADSGLSRNYFSARFRARFGRTAQSYLLLRRIEAARLLLISTGLPVKEIAFECGIPDPNHFNKQFRQIAGMSPTDYRAQHAKKW